MVCYVFLSRDSGAGYRNVGFFHIYRGSQTCHSKRYIDHTSRNDSSPPEEALPYENGPFLGEFNSIPFYPNICWTRIRALLHQQVLAKILRWGLSWKNDRKIFGVSHLSATKSQCGARVGKGIWPGVSTAWISCFARLTDVIPRDSRLQSTP